MRIARFAGPDGVVGFGAVEGVDFGPALEKCQKVVDSDKSVADMNYIDLYSCFPSAVEIGARAASTRRTTGVIFGATS